MGASTLGASSPSQYILRSIFLRCQRSEQPRVTQICLTQPAPLISASVNLSPGGTLKKSLLAPVASWLETLLLR